MTEKIQSQLSDFAKSMSSARSFLSRVKTNEELALELASRGVSKGELELAEEALFNVEDKTLYGTPEPV